jgi:hypothetical protein
MHQIKKDNSGQLYIDFKEWDYPEYFTQEELEVINEKGYHVSEALRGVLLNIFNSEIFPHADLFRCRAGAGGKYYPLLMKIIHTPTQYLNSKRIKVEIGIK